MTTTPTTPTDWEITGDQRREIVAQITMPVVLSISGGRITALRDGIELPVSSGYKVRVHLTPADTYTVERVMTRGSKTFVKGHRSGVFYDQVSDAAYYAGMYKSYGHEGDDRWQDQGR